MWGGGWERRREASRYNRCLPSGQHSSAGAIHRCSKSDALLQRVVQWMLAQQPIVQPIDMNLGVEFSSIAHHESFKPLEPLEGDRALVVHLPLISLEVSEASLLACKYVAAGRPLRHRCQDSRNCFEPVDCD